jgi:hypothetical protein
MKHIYQAALVAAIGLANIPAAHAAAYTSGDLLIGFTSTSGNDLIYDLGSASSLYNGETWSGLTSLLLADVNNASGFGASATLGNLYWGVIGNGPNSGTPRTFYTTTIVGQIPSSVTGNSAFGKLNTAATALAGNGPGGALTVGQSATMAASVSGNSSWISWNTETLNGALTTDYINAYENPNVLGVTSSDFSTGLNDGSTPTLTGQFTLGSDGSLTFNAVPEPSTYSLLAGAGILAVILRARRNRAQA